MKAIKFMHVNCKCFQLGQSPHLCLRDSRGQ